MSIRRYVFLAILHAVIFAAASATNPNDPITGAAFYSLQKAQEIPLQRYLESMFPEQQGYQITGPLDPFFAGQEPARDLYFSLRVICPEISLLEKAGNIIRKEENAKAEKQFEFIHQAAGNYPVGYRGILIRLEWQGESYLVQFNTINQTRWLIWAHDMLEEEQTKIPVEKIDVYAVAVSDHLYALDRGWEALPTPKATEYGLPEKYDIYRQPPDYVIAGYKNYKDYLKNHAGISTDFARGITSFVPTDSLLRAIKTTAPLAAYPNKEARMLQHEYLKFFARGGYARTMKTLTAALFDSLIEGEYFFAVGVTGKIRFGRELLREEVLKIETETGKKVPRANHAFLFPGEPVLTAGAFFIERDSTARIVKLNAQSGHYFYSNINKTIREDVAEKSNRYLMTLGHFFEALDRLGISYSSILISKF